jgi:hypothetical protein
MEADEEKLGFCWLDVGLQLGCIGAELMLLYWGLGIVTFSLIES